MAGSGITLYAMQMVYSYPEGSVPLAFLIIGIPVALSAASLALMMMCAPRSGGPYVWGSRFIDPFFGWLGTGWVYFLSNVFSVALVAYTIEAVFPVIFVVMGTGAKVPGLVNLGLGISSNYVMQIALAVGAIVLMGLVTILNIKYYMRVLMVLWAINLVGIVVSFGLFLGNNAATIPANWDALWGAGSFETIVSLAGKYNLAGYVTSTTSGFWTDTLSIMAYIFWALAGWEATTTVSGEVRNPRVSFLYFYIAGVVATIVWYAGITAAAYNTYGGFILQYNYVYNLFTAGKLSSADAAAVSSYMLSPSMPLFAGSLGGSNTLLVLLGSLWFWPLTATLTCVLLATRVAFGMSFDRMFPTAFGKVSDRTHTPVVGAAIVTTIAVFWCLIMSSVFGFLVSAANTDWWITLGYLIMAVSAVALPYRRKDVWEKGVAKRIFGIPDSAFFGGLATIGMLWLFELSAIGVSILAWNATLVWMAAGVLIYLFFVRKLERHGVDVKQVYGEVPPP
jgi:amino acid transporter